MSETVFRRCPDCDSEDIPTLVVRGSGGPGNGMSLRCKACAHEWADHRSSYALHLGGRDDGWWPAERWRMG